jgi:hypothetical protein
MEVINERGYLFAFFFFFFAFGGHARALFMEFGVDIGKSGLLATFQGFPKRNLI